MELVKLDYGCMEEVSHNRNCVFVGQVVVFLYNLNSSAHRWLLSIFGHSGGFPQVLALARG